MDSLHDFPITRHWPPRHPDRLQVYAIGSPNGVKIPIMLEETGLAYEAHRVAFEHGEQRSAEFLSLNPNGRIPAILDPAGPDGRPLALWESAAILQYLADKTGQLLPTASAQRWHCLQWLTFQAAAIGPMFGQLGWFVRFDGRAIEDPRPRQRYAAESRRLLGILDRQLHGRPWLLGDEYTIADIAIWPMVRNLIDYYEAGDLVGYADFADVQRVLAAFLQRDAVGRGLAVYG